MTEKEKIEFRLQCIREANFALNLSGDLHSSEDKAKAILKLAEEFEKFITKS